MRFQLGMLSDFDIEGLFREAASNDFDRAVQLARGFGTKSCAQMPVCAL